jgi:hypothetical protein
MKNHKRRDVKILFLVDRVEKGNPGRCSGAFRITEPKNSLENQAVSQQHVASGKPISRSGGWRTACPKPGGTVCGFLVTD